MIQKIQKVIGVEIITCICCEGTFAITGIIQHIEKNKKNNCEQEYINKGKKEELEMKCEIHKKKTIEKNNARNNPKNNPKKTKEQIKKDNDRRTKEQRKKDLKLEAIK